METVSLALIGLGFPSTLTVMVPPPWTDQGHRRLARLGDRLRFSVSLPVSLGAVSVPSMILLTLVENAIKHGIEPSLRGGEVSVSAQHEGERIRIRVEDTGVGMDEVRGGGDGLENVRRRLHLAHGDAATLELHDGQGHGFVAEILLPATIANEVNA